MEEQNENGEKIVVVPSGKYWKVKNVNHYYDNTFTEYAKAVKFAEGKKAEIEESKFKAALRQIKKEPDLGKRTREYKKLCQTRKSS